MCARCLSPVEERLLYLKHAAHYVLLQLRKFPNMSADEIAAYALILPIGSSALSEAPVALAVFE